MPKAVTHHAEPPVIDPSEPITHPEEIRWAAEFRLPGKSTVRLGARFTPAGVVCAGLMASGVILSAAALARALRPRD